jgi:hypothetical protein
VATVLQHQLLGCDGFRVESTSGLLGLVEETWLEPTGEPTALAIRTPDGRRGLLVAADVDAVVSSNELVHMRPQGRVLELDVPRVETGSSLSASWRTTGQVLEVLPSAGMERGRGTERPLWQVVAVLYAGVAMVVGLVMALAFLAAYLAGGAAY